MSYIKVINFLISKFHEETIYVTGDRRTSQTFCLSDNLKIAETFLHSQCISEKFACQTGYRLFLPNSLEPVLRCMGLEIQQTLRRPNQNLITNSPLLQSIQLCSANYHAGVQDNVFDNFQQMHSRAETFVKWNGLMSDKIIKETIGSCRGTYSSRKP